MSCCEPKCKNKHSICLHSSSLCKYIRLDERTKDFYKKMGNQCEIVCKKGKKREETPF